jgi:hypothetical protein
VTGPVQRQRCEPLKSPRKERLGAPNAARETATGERVGEFARAMRDRGWLKIEAEQHTRAQTG